MKWPTLQPIPQHQEMQQEFLGLNRSLRSDARQWHDTQNVSPREFPVFASRVPRGDVKTLTSPAGILSRDALVHIDGETLYINDYPVTGLSLLTGAQFTPKKLVSMGAYIIILPDKVYVNTADLSDFGQIESHFSYTGDVMLTPARVDGSDVPMEGVVVGTEPPADPSNGSYWIDTTGETHVLRQYSSLSSTWVEIMSTYIKIALPGIGAQFNLHDGVTLSGIEYTGTDPDLLTQVPALNAATHIAAIHDNYIIVPGLLSKVHTLTGNTISVSRTMPDMDYITESENRLWGCFYGMKGGKTVNEIYACAQGDFRNWNRFMGISTDSYAASVGTDGVFTGAITYQGYPLFLKETAMHKVYGGMPSNYRIETYACRGLQNGSWRSLQIVNEMLFYKGRTDVLVYDGSDPMSVSEALGDETYRDAVAGAYKHLYYISMKDAQGAYHLYVYDTRLRMWFREDNTRAMGFAQVDDDLLYINEDTRKIMSVFGKSGEREGPVPFAAQTGIIGFETKDHKYVSRYNIRALVPADGEIRVYFRYDSVGDWRLAGSLSGEGYVRSTMLPVRPRRCDHYEMRIEGAGDVRIFSIARIMEQGGDGRWI